MTRLAAIAAVIGLALGSAAADAKPKPKAKAKPGGGQFVFRRAPQPSPGAGPGQITYTTATTAYVNRGLADGLTVGAGLVVTRAGRLVGRCTITAASDRWATCAADAMRAGDRIAIDRKPAVPPAGLAPVPDAEALALRRARLDDAPVALVDFSGGTSGLLGGSGRVASLAISHESFFDLGPAGGRFDVQRIDVGVYDVQIWRGIHASADLTILNYSQRPVEHRSTLGRAALLVRVLEIAYHRPDFPFVAQAGRTWVRAGPGLLLLDGAQAAWRSSEGGLEAGAYGGFLPEPAGLVPTTQRFGAGAFVKARLASGRGTSASLLQVEARVGWAERFPLAGRLEIAAAVHAWLTQRFDAHLAVELGALGAQAPGLIDGARLDFGWRPTDRVRVSAAGRYDAAGGFDVTDVGVATGDWQSVRTDAALTIELSEGLWLGVSGGASADLLGGPTQVWLGPELTLPRVTPWAVAAIAYREELGFVRGRSASVQLTVTPWTRLRVLGRLSWFHQQDGGLAGHDLGAALMVDVAITRWLWLRASALGRAAPSQLDGSPAAGSVLAQLGGQL